MYYAKRKRGLRAYPYGYSGALSGMGQVIPGVKAETQKLVIYGSIVLVGASVLLFFALKGRTQTVAPAKLEVSK